MPGGKRSWNEASWKVTTPSRCECGGDKILIFRNVPRLETTIEGEEHLIVRRTKTSRCAIELRALP